jgi:hypothetical protein
MEMRSRVEKSFQKQAPDKQGLFAREKFMKMLEQLGLNKDEAVLLLNECDPKRNSRMQYTDFLDFVFGKCEEAKVEEKPIVEVEKAKETELGDQSKKPVGLGNKNSTADFEDHPSDQGTAEQPAQSDENSQAQELGDSKYCSDVGLEKDGSPAEGEGKSQKQTEGPAGVDSDSDAQSVPAEALPATELKQCNDCGELQERLLRGPLLIYA